MLSFLNNENNRMWLVKLCAVFFCEAPAKLHILLKNANVINMHLFYN